MRKKSQYRLDDLCFEHHAASRTTPREAAELIDRQCTATSFLNLSAICNSDEVITMHENVEMVCSVAITVNATARAAEHLDTGKVWIIRVICAC